MDVSLDLSEYKHKLKIQVRFKDIDKQGHVNNANHLTYFEIARVEYFKDVFRNSIDWIRTGMILATSHITYKQPIFLEDNLYCYTKITRFGSKSFDVTNVLAKETDAGTEVCAFGGSVLVCMNYDSKQTIEIPQPWIEAVKRFEGY